MSGVEAKDEQLFRKQKVLAEKCDIVVIDEEGESSLPNKGIVIGEENSTEKSNTSFSEKIISQSKFKAQQAEEELQVQTIFFSQEKHCQYKSKDDVFKNYAEMRNSTVKEEMKMMSQARQVARKGVSLYFAKDDASNTLKIVVTYEQKMSEVNFIMDRVNIPDKIDFHKQVFDVLCSNLLSSFLNKSKLEDKVSKLKDQIKREKTMSKGWKNKIKKLEVDLVAFGGKSSEKKSAKKLLEEKDKTIQSLKKQLKIPDSDHPQTRELVVL